MKTFFWLIVLVSIKTQAAIKTPDWLSANVNSPFREVLVAIIDTGIDVLHPDLQDSLWKNSGEIPNNGIDDDLNGYIDDVHGWDFTKDSAAISDRHGHGTHVTGIIKKWAPNAKFMALKYYDLNSTGDETIRYSIQAMLYAIKMGAQIINYSGGGSGFNSQERKILELAKQKNILVVCAAGNFSQNTDIFPFYPASYQLSNIVSVASWDGYSDLVVSSNFGRRTVDIAAPGESIESTMPAKSYGKMTGTSQATAFVTAAAALMIGRSKVKLQADQIKQKIIVSGDFNKSFVNKIKHPVRLNIQRAVNSVD